MKKITQQALTTIGLIVLYVLLLAPISIGNSELTRAIEDAGHGPPFGALAVFALLHLRRNAPATPRQYALALTIAVALGAVGEAAQFQLTSTRYAQLKDLWTDAAGAIAGLCFYARTDTQLRLRRGVRRLLGPLVAAICLVIAAPVAWSSTFYIKRWLQAPELVTFESKFGYHFLSAGNARTMLALIPPQFAAYPDEYALYVTPQLDNRWTGITLEEPLPDWRAYANLEIEVINPNDAPLELLLRIDDRDHNQEFTDRFNRTLTIGAKQRSVQIITLSDIELAPATRQMALDEMARLVLFQDTQRHPQAFYLRSLRLTK